LQEAVVASLAEIERLRERASHAETQGAELDEMLRGVTAGEQSPREMIDRLGVLEEENRDLRERLFEGRTTVDRLLARIQFLEDQR
jgi:hypothetical protein